MLMDPEANRMNPASELLDRSRGTDTVAMATDKLVHHR